MKIYQHILVVANTLTEREVQFMQQVIDEHPEVQVKLSLVYTVPKIPGEYFCLPSVVALKTKLEKEAHQHLDRIGDLLKISTEDRGIVVASGNREVERIAKMMRVDMIINNRQTSTLESCGFKWSALPIPCVRLDNSLRSAIGTMATHGGIMAY